MKHVFFILAAIVFVLNYCHAQEILPAKERMETNKSDSCSVKNKQDGLKNKAQMYFVEEMPEPIEGFNTIYQFIQDNLIYPEEAKSKGIEGKVFVEFIIEEDGTISNVGILQGLHPDLDEEAIRVINMFPKWKPGKKSGKPVRCYYQLPVSFKLSNNEATIKSANETSKKSAKKSAK
jgi:TonB family protein